MADFPGLALTDKGLALQTKAQAGAELNFSRVALGDGIVPPDPKILLTLVDEKKSLPLTSLAVIEAGHVRLRVVLTNDDVVSGFYIREVGVFAIDPDTGIEYLYAYTNAGEFSDYMPAGGGATVVEHEVDLITVVGDAANLTATIDKSKVYATQQDLEDLHGIIDASNGIFAKKVDVEGTYLKQTDASDIYLTQEDAPLTYLKQDDANNTYLKQEDASDTYATETRVNGLESTLNNCATSGELTELEDSVSETYTTKTEFNDHLNQAETALDGPQLIFPGSSNSFEITNFNIFSVYGVSATTGTASIVDNQVVLDIAIGESASGTVLTITQDGATKEFNIAIGSQSISKPSILAPSDGAINVGDEPLIASSNFNCFPSGEFTHISTDYQIATDSGFSNIIWQSMGDTENLLSIRVPAEILQTSTLYFLRLRHNGDNEIDTSSLWSDSIIFDTADSFYLANSVGELVPSDNEQDLESFAISGNGNTIIMGYPAAKIGSDVYRGKAYVFSLLNGSYQEEIILSPSSGEEGDYFGAQVSISNNGLLAAISAPGSSSNDRGYVCIYSKEGGFWTLINNIKPDDLVDGSHFGRGVCLSGDGQTLAITTYSASKDLYIFKKISGVNWQQTAKIPDVIPSFNTKISINNDGLSIALQYGDLVSIYNDITGDGSTWEKSAILDALLSDSISDISISGDGKTVLIGCSHADSSEINNGAAYIFEDDQVAGWELKTALPPITDDYLYFGRTVELSYDGSLAVIGCNSKFYIFKKDQNMWSRETINYTVGLCNLMSTTSNGKTLLIDGRHSAYVYQ